jgi:hypothetical protein
MDDCWCVFPWDAFDIYDHTRLAEAPGAHSGGAAGGGIAAPKAEGCATASSLLAASARKLM